jgi:hypothetical protein
MAAPSARDQMQYDRHSPLPCLKGVIPTQLSQDGGVVQSALAGRSAAASNRTRVFATVTLQSPSCIA